MPNLTIKGVPDQLYRQLKRRAQGHRRSLNSEIIVCLEEATSLPRVDPETWLREVEALRKETALPPLNDEELREAKGRGRP